MNDYTLNIDFWELNLLHEVIETTINRQLNFIATQSKLLKELDNKLKEVQSKIEAGKKGFLYNPASEFDKLIRKKTELEKPLKIAKADLTTARELYEHILDAKEIFKTGSKEVFRKERLFQAREDAYIIPGLKDYFYSKIGN